MIVGEAPGQNEERLGQPFVGAAGQLQDEMLAACGIPPESVFFTNMCAERPPNNDLGTFFTSDGLPMEPVMRGLAALKEQIASVRPTVIIPVGSYPLRFLTGHGRWSRKEHSYVGIGDYRGSILAGSPIAGGAKCVPTYHPAYVLRQYPDKAIVKLDLRRALEQSKFPEIRRPRKAIVVNPGGAEQDAWTDWMVSPEGTLSPEVELSTIDPYKGNVGTGRTVRLPSCGFLTGDIEGFGPKLLCLGLTRHPDAAICFLNHGTSSVGRFRYILESGVPLCFQNGMFDCSILEYHHNIKCMRHLRHDTMLSMHAAYTEFPKNLGFIGSIFTELPMWWEAIDWKKIQAGKSSIDVVWPYNANDTWVTADAQTQMLADELQTSDVRDTAFFENTLVDPLWETSLRGVRIDTERLALLKTTLEREAVDLNAGLMLMNKGKELNVKSPPQVAAFIQDVLGLPITARTPAGAPKTNDDTLADLLNKCRTASQRTGIIMVRDVRERRDLISKFCEIELDDDSRMRCHYDPAKTAFGRLSSRKFYPTDRGSNLQNVPRDPRVRSVFVPDRGYVFGYADLKQAESLVVAHLTGDPQMLYLHSDEYLFGGKDGHKYVASYIFGKPQEFITKDERFIGKKIRHACNYVMGWFRLMQVINAETQKTGVSVTAAEAKVYVAKYRALHYMLEQWWRLIEQELYATKRLTTLPKLIEREYFPWLFEDTDATEKWIVRPHTFFDRVSNILPEAVSMKPQGTVADVLNIGYVRSARDQTLRELGFQILLQVHDAIGFQCPEQNVDPVCARLQKLMKVDVQCERPGVAPFIFNIPVDIQVGENWGEADKDVVDVQGNIKKKAVNLNGLKVWKPAA